MDYVKRLNEEVKKGFTKSYLEKLIGLPKNTLAGCLKGSKKMTPANQALTIRFLLEHPELDILSMPKRTRKVKLKFIEGNRQDGVLATNDKKTIKLLKNHPRNVNSQSREEIKKPQIPKGLSLDERIKWIEENG